MYVHWLWISCMLFYSTNLPTQSHTNMRGTQQPTGVGSLTVTSLWWIIEKRMEWTRPHYSQEQSQCQHSRDKLQKTTDGQLKTILKLIKSKRVGWEENVWKTAKKRNLESSDRGVWGKLWTSYLFSLYAASTAANLTLIKTLIRLLAWIQS